VLHDLRPISGAVLRVRPKYIVDTCSGTAQVSGPQFLLRRSAETAPLLACPTARAHVGGEREPSPASGAPWLPEGWLDVEVKPEAEGIPVTLSMEKRFEKREALSSRGGVAGRAFGLQPSGSPSGPRWPAHSLTLATRPSRTAGQSSATIENSTESARRRLLHVVSGSDATARRARLPALPTAIAAAPATIHGVQGFARVAPSMSVSPRNIMVALNERPLGDLAFSFRESIRR